jgi:hypothetical protein
MSCQQATFEMKEPPTVAALTWSSDAIDLGSGDRSPIPSLTKEGFAIGCADDFEVPRNGFHAHVVNASLSG